jgi:hypothetical protein
VARIFVALLLPPGIDSCSFAKGKRETGMKLLNSAMGIESWTYNDDPVCRLACYVSGGTDENELAVAFTDLPRSNEQTH